MISADTESNSFCCCSRLNRHWCDPNNACFSSMQKFKCCSFTKASLRLWRETCGARQCVWELLFMQTVFERVTHSSVIVTQSKTLRSWRRCPTCGTSTKGRHRQQVEPTSAGDLMALQWQSYRVGSLCRSGFIPYHDVLQTLKMDLQIWMSFWLSILHGSHPSFASPDAFLLKG